MTSLFKKTHDGLTPPPALVPVLVCTRCNCYCRNAEEVRSGLCAKCRRKLVAINRTINQRMATVTKEVTTFTSKIRKVNAPNVGELCEAMINKFGGLQQFVESWHLNITNAEVGSKTALDGHAAVAKLIKDWTDLRKSTDDAEELTPEDIDREILELVFSQISPNLLNDLQNLEYDPGSENAPSENATND